MFSVDKGANPALFLLFRDAMQRQRGLARAFGAINLDDAALRQTTDAKGDIKAKRACRCRLDVAHGVVATQLHDRALAKLAFDLGQCAIERLLFVGGNAVCHIEKRCRCHYVDLLIPRHGWRGNGMLMFTSCSVSLLQTKQEHFK